MQLAEFIFLGVLDQIAYILISKKLLCCSNIKTKKILLFFIAMIGIAHITFYLNENPHLILNIAILFLFTLYIYGKDLFESFYATIITVSIITTIQTSIIVVLSLIIHNIEVSFYYGVLAQCILLIIVFVFTKYIPLNLIFRFINKRNKVFITLTMNGFFLVFIILAYWSYDINGFFENIILIGIVAIILIALNFLFIVKGLENKHEKAQLEIYNRYQKITENLIDDIRSRQHEFDNHIQAISMCRNNDIDINYIKDLHIKNNLGSLIKLESSLLGGLIYGKKKEAITNGINFEINIENFESSKVIKEYELIDIVGNLLDNAFEATEKLDDKNVILNFIKENNKDVIQVKNNCKYLNNDKILEIFKKGFSTKQSSSSSRGFGLYNIKKILDKYNSEIEVQNLTYLDENYIMFKINI